MQYIDSGSRDAAQTLAAWLRQVLTDDVSELRFQTAFFNSEPLGLFNETLASMARDDRRTRALIGANDGGTLLADLSVFARMLGVPRPNADFGVVRFQDAFFHPKTVHVLRRDGSQAAYVGSSNLTGRGTTVHVEAGIILDSGLGDPVTVLGEIATAIDRWFQPGSEGVHLISTLDDLEALADTGVIARVASQRPRRVLETGADAESADAPTTAPYVAPRLRSIFELPPIPMAFRPTVVPRAAAASLITPALAPAPPAPVPRVGTRTTANREGFPEHVLFDPGAMGPTSGLSALTNTTLPTGIAGLILRLSRDDTRVFSGGVGTANISLPHQSLHTLRFGVLGRGKNPSRPRAEFDLYARFLHPEGTIELNEPTDTNVMLYGYLEGESGHQNTRMLLPADLRVLAEQITDSGRTLPVPRNYALLEWPTANDPSFRISFLESGSHLATQAQQRFDAESASGRLVGDGACWLNNGMSPAWD